MKIFISYRRKDSSRDIGRIRDRLQAEFGGQSVFRDLVDIHGGEDFRMVLERETNGCDVMLVMIGPNWAGITDANGNKRLFDPADYTRIEVETGLRRIQEDGAMVIPILVANATMPSSADLPESLAQLTYQNGISVRDDPDFDHDMDRLIRDIRRSNGYIREEISKDYYEPETLLIPEGSFWMSCDPGEPPPAHEPPRHEIFLPAYRIGKHPVTNEQYQEFVQQTDRPLGEVVGWDGRRVRSGSEEKPVMGVRWEDALEYCRWLSTTTGREYSLPNEAQLDKAFYTPPGCDSMVGNLNEWTCTLWGEKIDSPDIRYRCPWKNDGRNNLNANLQIRRVICFFPQSQDPPSRLLRPKRRFGRLPKDPGLQGERHGFRVVMKKQSS